MQVVFPVLVLVVMVFTLVNVITIDSWRVRHLDKVVWAFIVILLPLIGSVLWWTIGRERPTAPRPAPARETLRYEAERMPQRQPTDDEIDAEVEREIQRHENEARIRRLERELEQRRHDDAP